MNKEEFLSRLSEKLTPLDQLERVRMLQYYREIIEDRVEDGLTEEAAVAELESLDTIAAGILEELGVKTAAYAQVPRKKRSAFTVVLLVLGAPVWLTLLLAAGAVLLAMYAVVWALVISLFAVVAALGAAGIAGVIGMVIYLGGHAMTALFLLGAGLLCAALAIALFLPICRLAKWLIVGTAKAGRGAWKAVFHKRGQTV